MSEQKRVPQKVYTDFSDIFNASHSFRDLVEFIHFQQGYLVSVLIAQKVQTLVPTKWKLFFHFSVITL